MKRIKLYRLILVACLLGYAWFGYVLNQSDSAPASELNVCMIKNVLHIPCPACGSTRSVIALWNGHLIDSIFINPFGLIISLILLVAPLWIIFDFLRKKESFYHIYRKSEIVIRRKQYSIPLIALVIGNWIWNIYKHL